MTVETEVAALTTAVNSLTSTVNVSKTTLDASVAAAEAAETAAEAAYDSFDDRYLGVKSSAPSTDNDGGALLTGALYFNSTNNTMNVFTGSAWAPVANNNIINPNVALTQDLATNGNDVKFGDNDKATFGASDDLSIYHDGSNSFITEAGAGSLKIRSDGSGVLIQGSNGDNLIFADVGDDVVKLFADGGNIKLATTATGIDVTGEITADALTINSSAAQIGTVLQSTSTTSARLALMDANTTAASQVGIGATGNTLGLYAAGGSPRVVVSGTGIDVTGTATVDGLTVDGNASVIQFTGTSGSSNVYSNQGFVIDIDHDGDQGGTSFDITADSKSKTVFKVVENGDVSFYEDTGSTPKMVWDAAAESLGIGTSSPVSDALLTLAGAQGATQSLYFNGFGTDLDAAISHSNANIIFSNGGNNTGVSALTERMRIDSSGHAIIPNGVTLGTAVGVYNAAKTLDDYEEGTFTPQIGDVSGNTGTLTTALGYYTKVGRQVTIVVDMINIDTTALVSTEQVRVKNLPFNAFTVGQSAIFTSVAQVGGVGATGKTIIASIQDEFGYIRIKEADSGLSGYLLVSDIGQSPLADIRFSLTYFAD